MLKIYYNSTLISTISDYPNIYKLLLSSTRIYKAKGLTARELEIMKTIDEIDTDHRYFGGRRMSKHLVAFEIVIGGKAVSRYYRMKAIAAVYPKMYLTKGNQALKLYPYLVKGVEITRTN